MRWLRPGSALFWVYWLIVLLGATALTVQLAPVVGVTWFEVLVGLPFCVATFAVYGWLLTRLDVLRARHVIRGVLAAGFLWGALAGPGIAMFANDHIMRVIQNLAGDDFANDWQAPISATIVEEGIKGLGVCAVAWLGRALLTRPIHGLLLGGFVGLGFQVVENLTYAANSGLNSAQGGAAPAVLVGALRLVVGLTSHWMFTALAGIGIVLAITRRDWPMAKRLRVFVLYYLIGCAMHFTWDAPDLTESGLFGTGGKMLLDVIVFAVIYRWVVRTERRWFRDIAPAAAAQGIAPIEELSTLLTRRSRRRARRAARRQGYPARQLRRRQRMLLYLVQRLGVQRTVAETWSTPAVSSYPAAQW